MSRSSSLFLKLHFTDSHEVIEVTTKLLKNKFIFDKLVHIQQFIYQAN